MYKSILLMCLYVALPVAEPAPQGLDLVGALQAQSYLTSQTSRCAQEVQDQFWTHSLTSLGGLANCSISGILNNTGYILLDTANFTNTTWNDVWDIVDSVEACAEERGVFGKIECVISSLNNSSDVFKNIFQAVEVFQENLEDIIPIIVSEVKRCVAKDAKKYEEVLRKLVKKVKSC